MATKNEDNPTKLKQRHSLAATTTTRLNSKRQSQASKDLKSARTSLATATTASRASFSNPSFAKKTKSSNSRLSDAKLEESNISVYVRCRSRNEREIKENSGVIVSTMGHLGKEVVLQTGPMSVSNKTYTFDRVFGAESDQEMIYEGIASSTLKEMLQGYNCTVFAYGQTGTGKTYTMSGDINNTGGRIPEEAGIIPRTLIDLFKNLEKNPEFSVKVSFIELYNEELRDLIPVNDSDERKVKIFEDTVNKTIIVQGMEEVYIKSAEEGMKLLADGSYKRQVAATQCNDLSSRSHSVFTITVHMKEIDPISGEEYLKVGKLNLVDLAGSENINRSGAENKRAREAGMINQSLLTLGRVINSLVDRSPHIPYRESKLTRLLQDSLGGKTKTCIIATISPAKVSLEETISTLEYANRAKSIKNKPQVNQTMSKKMLIKEYIQEIERLRTDLNATRNKNGVYLTEENLQQITDQSESRRIQVDEQKLRINFLEDQIKKFKGDFESYLDQIKSLEENLDFSREEHAQTIQKLDLTTTKLDQIKSELKIEKYVNLDHEIVQADMRKIHTSVVSLFEKSQLEKDAIIDLFERKKEIESTNLEQLNSSKNSILKQSSVITNHLSDFYSKSSDLSTILNDNFNQLIKTHTSKVEESCKKVSNNSESIKSIIEKSLDKVFAAGDSTNSKLENIELLKEEIKNEITKDLKEVKQENINSSVSLSRDLQIVSDTIADSFKTIEDHVKSIIDTVLLQVSNQSSEIISLKSTYLEHQKKYHGIIMQLVSKLENFKESEKQKSKVEREELFLKFKQVIEDHEQSKLKRFGENVDQVTPELKNIATKESEFAGSFDEFLSEKWIKTQVSFQDQLTEQKIVFTDMIEEISQNKKKNISKLKSNLRSELENQAISVEKVMGNISTHMQSLTSYSDDLKRLNKENTQFNQTQLEAINLQVFDAFTEITSNFAQFENELSNAKPELVDSFLQRQEEFLSNLKSSSIDGIRQLGDLASNIKYTEDDEPIPKRQKVEITTNLPFNQTREEIISKYSSEIYSKSLLSSTDSDLSNVTYVVPEDLKAGSALIPIPDKHFKQPLSTITKDLNIIKSNEGEVDEKLKNFGQRTRSSSSNSRSSRASSSLSFRNQ